MPLQYNKKVLEGNIFSKANQTLTIVGLGTLSNRPLTILSRDEITLEQPTIELADKTQVPGGRNNFGEFNLVIQLALDSHRQEMIKWYNECLNIRGGLNTSQGINPDYKKTGIIRFLRHFSGAPSAEAQDAGSGQAGRPFEIILRGIWPKSLGFPEYSMSDGDEGDADAQLTLSICYDDLEPQTT